MKKAFSLIELSIVILIIGVLIAGVTKASALVLRYKLHTLQKLTSDSPVAQIPNLVAWYETTLDESFDYAEAVNNTGISTWYDISKQKISPYNATQTTSGSRPKYTAISNSSAVPLISFSSNTQFFNLPDGTVPYGNSSYTVFLVSKINALCSCGVLASGNYGVTNQTNSFRYDGSGFFRHYWWSSDLDTTAGSISPANTMRILSFTYNNTIGRKGYINGALNITNSSITRASLSTNNFIGKTLGSGATPSYMNGYIGEIIIFDRALKNEERQAIEAYLGKKFSITVTQS